MIETRNCRQSKAAARSLARSSVRPVVGVERGEASRVIGPRIRRNDRTNNISRGKRRPLTRSVKLPFYEGAPTRVGSVFRSTKSVLIALAAVNNGNEVCV